MSKLRHRLFIFKRKQTMVIWIHGMQKFVYLFWVMCLVCIQFSDCAGRHTQFIWTLGVQKFVLFILGDLLGMFTDCIQKIIFVSIRLAPKAKGTPKASLASWEGGWGVAGWQDLKMKSGDIANLTPRARQDPPTLRTTPFQEGEDDANGTLGQPTTCNN
jgi:hypothetical protein